MRRASFSFLMVALLLGACTSERDYPAPPRVTSAPEFPRHMSTLLVPVSVSLDDIQRGLEQRTPRELWSIDELNRTCVRGQKVKIFGERLRVTPNIRCRIVGEVTRGAISLSGSGQQIRISLPVRARVSARDIGGVLKGETATGSAVVRADVRFSLDRDWNPRAKVDISYDWREPPGIDFLGERIRFARRADKELAKVIAGLERDVQREIARTKVRPIIADAWREGFAVIELNRERPPAWMRITPSGIGVVGYRVDGRTARLMVAAEARTETFVGNAPAVPEPTPLPAQMPAVRDKGLNFFIPVVADYAQLEPVVLRALRRLAQKGIPIKDVGRVDAEFDKVTIYATLSNRLAVGIEAKVEPVGARLGTRFGRARGEVWLTGVPVHAENSEVVQIQDLNIYGGADRMVADLLIQLMTGEKVRAELAASLTQDFSKDYNKVVTAARRAIAGRQEGDFRLSATIDRVQHERIQVTGAGLFMPVTVSGEGEIAYSPRLAKR